MGVYKGIADVPPHLRLDQQDSISWGDDLWATFVETRSGNFDSKHYLRTFDKTERSWKEHMRDRGRHFACCRPTDVDCWVSDLLDNRTVGTVYSEYWVRLEEFYTWLMNHTEFPHVYNPVLMAAAQYQAAGRIWEYKIYSQDAYRKEDSG
jgi:hypothetical protein